jgi:hypothetical protein
MKSVSFDPWKALLCGRTLQKVPLTIPENAETDKSADEIIDDFFGME